ncbi:maleylpyruvate isomerase N-terminal domain-containing protein [Streptomyces sp. MMS24-I2-30]|uniref:maleylpyruvate isomerase N-terminal domain-containing protein n=1 Tax=Streptomyces sp. MMS24-I2-30 TaxID=3351564 RepID=UPI003896BBFF
MQAGEPGPPDLRGCVTGRPVKGALRASLRDGALPHPGQPALSRGWLAIGRPRPCGGHAVGQVRVYLTGEKGPYSDNAGPDARVWTVVPDQPLVFWARRMLHETVVHRADAARTLGVGHETDAAVARDGLDEWMSFGTVPEAYDPGTDEPLLGAGRTLRLCATDDPAGDWFVDLTGDVPRWRHAGDAAAVTVRGPVTDLLLLVYGRPVDARTEVRGDRSLLDLWLRRTGFWLHE